MAHVNFVNSFNNIFWEPILVRVNNENFFGWDSIKKKILTFLLARTVSSVNSYNIRAIWHKFTNHECTRTFIIVKCRVYKMCLSCNNTKYRIVWYTYAPKYKRWRTKITEEMVKYVPIFRNSILDRRCKFVLAENWRARWLGSRQISQKDGANRRLVVRLRCLFDKVTLHRRRNKSPAIYVEVRRHAVRHRRPDRLRTPIRNICRITWVDRAFCTPKPRAQVCSIRLNVSQNDSSASYPTRNYFYSENQPLPVHSHYQPPQPLATPVPTVLTTDLNDCETKSTADIIANQSQNYVDEKLAEYQATIFQLQGSFII